MLEGISPEKLVNELSIRHAIEMKAYQNMNSIDDHTNMITLYKSYGLYKQNISPKAYIMNIKKG